MPRDRFELVMLAAMTVAVGFVIGLIVYAIVDYRADVERQEQARVECEWQGGDWGVVGQEESTTYVRSGQVTIPVTSTSDVYGCVGVE